MPTISAQDLRDRHALDAGVQDWIELFGHQPVEITAELCQRHAIDISWSWVFAVFQGERGKVQRLTRYRRGDYTAATEFAAWFNHVPQFGTRAETRE